MNDSKSASLKKLIIYLMVGALIGAASIAVIAVLLGSFSSVLQRALGTLAVVIGHALIGLAFINNNATQRKANFEFFENTFFGVVVLSFFTAVFGIWGLLPSDIIGKLYLSYGVIVFASLHGQMLNEAADSTTTITGLTAINYIFMSIVIMLLLPIIWVQSSDFPDVYYRLLAAAGIIDATLTMIVIILHKLYIAKHPKVISGLYIQEPGQNQPQNRRHNPLLILLGLFLLAQIIGPIVLLLSRIR
jgi:hypothetical protein